MSVTTGDVVAQVFTTSNPATGAAADADSLPIGVLWIDGVANAATVTISDLAGTGKYSFSVTVPTVTTGQRVAVIVDATIGGVACSGTVWEDQAVPAVNVTYWGGVAAVAGAIPAAAAGAANGLPVLDANLVSAVNVTMWRGHEPVELDSAGAVMVDVGRWSDAQVEPLEYGYLNINNVLGAVKGNLQGNVEGTINDLNGTAMQSVRDAMKLGPSAGDPATRSIDAKLDALGEAGDPWAAELPGDYEPDEAGYIVGRLAGIDLSEVTVVTSNVAGELTITAAATYTATVSGLTISGTWAKILLTIKRNTAQADAAAILQVQESVAGTGDGLLRINAAAPASPLAAASASLTVSQAGGTVAIAIVDEATAQLNPASGLVWDLKQIDAAGASTVLASGTCNVVTAVTRTV